MWKKDGVIYRGGGIVIDGKRYWNPTDEQFEAAGWTRYTPPEPPKRYSKLKVIRALGARWEAYKLQLEQAGLYDQFVAAAWLAEDDPAFAGVLANLTAEEREALAGCLYE